MTTTRPARRQAAAPASSCSRRPSILTSGPKAVGVQRTHPLPSVRPLAHFLDESLSRAGHGVEERRNELDIAWQGKASVL